MEFSECTGGEEEAVMSDPVSFSDEQFACVCEATQLLPPRLQSECLTDVTNRLAEGRDPRSLVNNVDVSRAINLALRELQVTKVRLYFLRPPDLPLVAAQLLHWTVQDYFPARPPRPRAPAPLNLLAGALNNSGDPFLEGGPPSIWG